MVELLCQSILRPFVGTIGRTWKLGAVKSPKRLSVISADLNYKLDCGILLSMNEKQTATSQTVRPTKKQKELLTYIEAFIAEHGYSPSYREIMNGLHYTSVATVSLHVGNLIKRGHVRKRDHSARSLEVIAVSEPVKITSNQVAPSQEKWLVEKVEHAFIQLENLGGELVESSLDHLYVLIGALKVLGLEGAAQSFMPRLTALKQRQTS